MADIWKYADADRICITDTSGVKHTGRVVCVTDAEEMYDAQEDEIAIETDNKKIFGFRKSEIEKIEIL